MQAIKEKIAKMSVTGKESKALGAGIYRYCREQKMRLSEFCGICGVSPAMPSNLYFKTQRTWPTNVIKEIVGGLGFDSLSKAVLYGIAADQERDKPPIVNGRCKSSRAARKSKEAKSAVVVKTPSVATFAEQLNALGKEDQEKVKKLVLYLYQKAGIAALEQEIRNF